MSTIYDYKLIKRDGSEFNTSDLKGKIVLVVNTATGCGFTPQYKALEELYKRYHDKGLEIIDLPCDQFGHQAPGTDDEIHEFCTAKYQTSFDQFKKIDVNGDNADAFISYIKNQLPQGEVKGLKNKMAMAATKKLSGTCKTEYDIAWNFTKFLIDREGNVIKRLEPVIDPMELEEDIKGMI